MMNKYIVKIALLINLFICIKIIIDGSEYMEEKIPCVHEMENRDFFNKYKYINTTETNDNYIHFFDLTYCESKKCSVVTGALYSDSKYFDESQNITLYRECSDYEFVSICQNKYCILLNVIPTNRYETNMYATFLIYGIFLIISISIYVIIS